MRTVAIRKEMLDLAEMALNFGCMKLSVREGFSVLMVTRRGGENSMTKITQNSVEEAIDYAERSLTSGHDANSSGYVLGYDVTIQRDGKPQRGFLLELESVDMPVCAMLFRATNAGELGKEPEHVVPKGSFILWQTRGKRLPQST